MERNSKPNPEEKTKKDTKALVYSNKTKDLKKNYGWHSCLHSLICECILFVSFGCAIALAGNIATLILYCDSVFTQPSNSSNITDLDDDKNKHLSGFQNKKSDEPINHTSSNEVTSMNRIFCHINY